MVRGSVIGIQRSLSMRSNFVLEYESQFKMKTMRLQMTGEKGLASWLLLGILSALMAMTSLSVDIYLPAMPKMQQVLQGNVELTITGFLIGFSIAQIFWGPISDKYGRKKPL